MMKQTLFQIALAALIIGFLSMDAYAQQRRTMPDTTSLQRHAPEPSVQTPEYSRECRPFQYGYSKGGPLTQIYITCMEEDSYGNQFFMKTYRDDNPWDIALMQVTFDMLDQAMEHDRLLNLSIRHTIEEGTHPTFYSITVERPR